MSEHPARTVVVCLGNPFRHDDGVGHAVAELLGPALPPGVELVELDGEPTRIVDAWAGAELAVVVDAARAAGPPGTIERIEVDVDAADGADRLPPPSRQASTHGTGLADAVELGRVLGRLPARLLLCTVAGGDFATGPGLSDAVARAVPDLATRLLDELPQHDPAGHCGRSPAPPH